jgi:transposase
MKRRADWTRIGELKRAGLSPRQIADRLGITMATVRTVLRRLDEEANGVRAAAGDGVGAGLKPVRTPGWKGAP